jgi:hypothetical protein
MGSRPNGAQAPFVAGAARGTKINGSDPALPAVCTSYPAPPLPPFLTTNRAAQLWTTWPAPPGSGIDFSAISFGKLLHVVVAESRCWWQTRCGVLEQSDRAGAYAKSA